MIFLLVPFLLLELYISLKVGESIGFLWSAIWIVVTMVIGIKLLHSSPLALMGNFSAMAQGKLSMKHFENAATFYLIGAVLLIIPGVLSDILGLIALFYTFYLQFVAKMKPEQPNPYQNQGEDDVIDVEIIEEHTDSDRRS